MNEEFEECPYCKTKYEKGKVPAHCIKCGMCLYCQD
jgi:hypothetical protein